MPEQQLGARGELLARNIRTVRNSFGETQQQLADAIHVTKQTVSNYERGASFPDMGILSSVAGHYGIPVGMLMDSPIPDLKQVFRTEHSADDFVGCTSSLFPLLESEEVSRYPGFSKAYRVCESIVSSGDTEFESMVEAFEVLCDIYEKKHSAEALVDALLIWFYIAGAMRFSGLDPRLVALLASDDFREGRASFALKDVMTDMQNSDLGAEDLKDLREFTVEFIRLLRGHQGFEDLAYYYVALGYLYGIMDGDFDLPESQQIASSMLFSMGSVGNRYARRALAAIWAFHHKVPEVKDA